MASDVFQTWQRASRDLPRNLAGGEIIPTWDVGQEQNPPHDLANFAEEGYSTNSLIYACIREKASSFAPLQPYIDRGNGEMLRRHRVLDLLRDPNTEQDGSAFSEEVMTHKEAAGNVYIEKVRQSSNADRRRMWRGYPVQELSPIRPDYVTIEPGAEGRASDVYLVTVGGTVRKRIPRSDMIHIRDVSLTNDFYGLSKIALLVREGSIDLHMSDFELSFFKNAGVPLGLMLVKRPQNASELEEAKRRFDRLFNGVKGWFRTLWLNAENADYKQLALAPKDMEQDSTRFHVESRICAVFGVHPMIVHARVANEMPQQPYEEVEHSFWAETMVPDAGRIASALSKQLLPEFATTRDIGAEIVYDTTVVRALQEDRSRKLREAVRLIITGGLMVSEAFRVVGLPPPPDSDFYVRTGNQVIVDAEGNITPMSTATGATEGADNPLEGAASSTRKVFAGLEQEDEEDELFDRLSIFLRDNRNGR